MEHVVFTDTGSNLVHIHVVHAKRSITEHTMSEKEQAIVAFHKRQKTKPPPLKWPEYWAWSKKQGWFKARALTYEEATYREMLR
jgi:hypothetical protein